MADASQEAQIKNDHDLLIRIDQRLIELAKNVTDLGQNLVNRVEELEKDKLSKEEAERLKKEADELHQDHEIRLRRVERWGAIAVGVLAAAEFYFKFIHK